jgi:hypothetical protein
MVDLRECALRVVKLQDESLRVKSVGGGGGNLQGPKVLMHERCNGSFYGNERL